MELNQDSTIIINKVDWTGKDDLLLELIDNQTIITLEYAIINENGFLDIGLIEDCDPTVEEILELEEYLLSKY